MDAMVEPLKLISCPDCAHQCSQQAISCPSCGKPFTPPSAAGKKVLDDKVFDHILMQSSMKVGMCLTLLGLIKVVEGAKNLKSFTDEFLAIVALFFTVSGIASYFAIKESNPDRKQQKGTIADFIFSIALCLLAIICAIIALQVM
ncbi:MAG: hypothetical protein AB1757_30425 [Acidobacteriota bacterium]